MANKSIKSADGLGSSADPIGDVADPIAGNDTDGGNDGSGGKTDSSLGKSDIENAKDDGQLRQSFETVAGPKRKRGRPKSTATKSKPAGTSAKPEPKEGLGLNEKPKPRPPTRDEIDGLAALVTMAANFAAMQNKAPDMVITPPEGARIAAPLAEVLAMWGIYLSPGESPYVKLASALIGVYGLRVLSRYQAAKAAPTNSAATPPNSANDPTRQQYSFEDALPTLDETEAEAATRQAATQRGMN